MIILSWTIEWFYCILLALITSSIYFLLWKLLELVSLKTGATIYLLHQLIFPGILLSLIPAVYLFRISWSVLYERQAELFASSNTIAWMTSGMFVVWVMGILVQFYKVRKNDKRIRDFLQECEPITDSVVLSILNQYHNELHLPSKPLMYYCDYTESPCTLYSHSSVIILPRRNYSEYELQIILLHECIHIKHRDLQLKRFLHLVEAMFWFVPFVGYIKYDVDLICECACDQAVLQYQTSAAHNLVDFQSYFYLVLSHMEVNKEFMLSFSNKNNMRYRIFVCRPHARKNTSILLSLLIAMFIISLPILSAQAATKALSSTQSYLCNLTTDANIQSDTTTLSDYIEYTEAEDPLYWNTLPEQDTLEPSLLAYTPTLSPGNRRDSGNISCTASTEITLTGWVVPKGTVHVGITDGDVRTYIIVTNSVFEHTFRATHTATYRVFIANEGDETIKYSLNIAVSNPD